MANIVFTPNTPNYSITNVSGTAQQAVTFPSSASLVAKASSLYPLPASSPSIPVNKSFKAYKKPSPVSVEKQDVYTRVTSKIIADLEKGNLTWLKPWETKNFTGYVSRRLRVDGTPYQGINVLSLWGTAAEQGYISPFWITYNKAKELGAQVKKGEKGTLVVYANKIIKSETDDQGTETGKIIPFLKGYTVFNAEQVTGLPETFYTVSEKENDPINRIEAVEAFVSGTKADIRHEGAKACYVPSNDFIRMPVPQAFRDTESYYAVLSHELVHWTNPKTRLDRNFASKCFGDKGHAVEELVAEIGAAFLCADLKITPEPREDHAAYIQSWLKVLKNDRRAIFTAASHAQRAVDYLHGLNSPQPTAN